MDNVNNNEIIIWHEMDGSADTSLKMIEEVSELFSKKTGITFKLVSMNINKFIENLNKISETGDAPHIAFIPQDMVTMDLAKLSEVPIEAKNKNISSELWDTMKFRNIQRGVPFLRGNHAVMYYNKEIFDSAPKTWEDIIENKAELHNKGIIPISIDLKVSYYVMSFVCTFGEFPIVKGKTSLKNAGMVKALEFLKLLEKENILVSLSAIDAMLDKFTAGEIGAIVNGEWIFNYLYSKLKDKLGVCRIPCSNGKPTIGLTTTIGMVFPNNSLESEYRNVLIDYAKYMTDIDCQRQWFHNHRRLPINQQVFDEIKDSTDNNWKEIMYQMELNNFVENDEGLENMWKAMDLGLNFLANSNNIDEAIKVMQTHIK